MIYLELFWVFFLIGAFTFGGGYAMIAMIQQQVVSRGWMGMEEIIDFVLDRPFLFVIADYNGIPLFAGVVNNP